MKVNPRIKCADGVSLSVQANRFAYCTPRIDAMDGWSHYVSVEVGFIEDSNGAVVIPPDEWREHAGEFPSDVYGYVPVEMVEAFIAAHGGEIV